MMCPLDPGSDNETSRLAPGRPEVRQEEGPGEVRQAGEGVLGNGGPAGCPCGAWNHDNAVWE